MTDTDDGNGGPQTRITNELCEAYRSHLETKIDRISYTVKLSGAIVSLIVVVIQLGLYYLG